MATINDQLNKLLTLVVEGLGYELWGYEYRVHSQSALLRVFIDSSDGVKLDDCAKVSEQLSATLDVEDPIPVAYTLEVSSPGLDRVLFKPEHYQRYIGQSVKVRTKVKQENRRNFVGVLVEATDQVLSLEINGTRFDLSYDTIDRGRLLLD